MHLSKKAFCWYAYREFSKVDTEEKIPNQSPGYPLSERFVWRRYIYKNQWSRQSQRGLAATNVWPSVNGYFFACFNSSSNDREREWLTTRFFWGFERKKQSTLTLEIGGVCYSFLLFHGEVTNPIWALKNHFEKYSNSKNGSALTCLVAQKWTKKGTPSLNAFFLIIWRKWHCNQHSQKWYQMKTNKQKVSRPLLEYFLEVWVFLSFLGFERAEKSDQR